MAERDDLDVLACELALRPREAPSFMDVASAVRRVQRETGALTVEFDRAAVRAVTELVAAERLCCAGLQWDLQTEPALVLRIGATEAQLEVLEQLVRGA